ncbi:MAG: cyclic nucleotide-binding domain-containing protein [Elusimicrobia bacterium]|nr:cyclic nucleotide-binding domain-containing protein [Elusimicrobiota bacterium]
MPKTKTPPDIDLRKERSRALAGSVFFRGLKPEHLSRLLDHASAIRLEDGQRAFRVGGKAAGFYFITQGKMAVELPVCGGATCAIQFLKPGEVLGWSWLIPPYRWHLGARAVGPVDALFFDGMSVRKELFRDPAMGFELYRRFAAVMSRRLEGAFLKLYSDE